MRDIAGDCVRPAARGADLGGGLLDLVARARGEPDFGAGLSEGDGAGPADAAAGAGDEGGAAFEAEARADVHAAILATGEMKGPARGRGLGARLSGRRLTGRLFCSREGGRGEPAGKGQVSRRVAGNPITAAAEAAARTGSLSI